MTFFDSRALNFRDFTKSANSAKLKCKQKFPVLQYLSLSRTGCDHDFVFLGAHAQKGQVVLRVGVPHTVARLRGQRVHQSGVLHRRRVVQRRAHRDPCAIQPAHGLIRDPCAIQPAHGLIRDPCAIQPGHGLIRDSCAIQPAHGCMT